MNSPTSCVPEEAAIVDHSDIEGDIARHYSPGGLYERILNALAENGIAEADLEPAHLRAVEEFHIGGGPATEHLLDPLGIGPDTRVLDIGCGIGGAVRHMARTYGAQITGMDLTPDYVETAGLITDRFGIAARFTVGSALDLPFDADSFDLATLLHVGMNIPDKPRLFAETARVLTPGGTFAVYDVMLTGAHPDFPLPWSTRPDTSFLAPPEAYLAAAEAAGFTLQHREERGEVARTFFQQMKARIAAEGPPVVGPPLMMGDTAPQKVDNMTRAVMAGDITPVEMVFRAPG